MTTTILIIALVTVTLIAIVFGFMVRAALLARQVYEAAIEIKDIQINNLITERNNYRNMLADIYKDLDEGDDLHI